MIPTIEVAVHSSLFGDRVFIIARYREEASVRRPLLFPPDWSLKHGPEETL
jgi:hypothetical protein